MGREQNDKKELEHLFHQWCEHTIDNRDVPRLMYLLKKADTKGTLPQLMKEVYLQIRDNDFFSKKEKRKIFLNAIQPIPKTIPLRRKLLYSLSAAASIVILAGASYFFYFSKIPSEKTITRQSLQDIAAPTQYSGSLVLANGNIIDFSKAVEGTIASEGNITITKKANGSLIFKGSAKKVQTNTLTVPKGSKPMHLLLADGTSVLLNVASSITFPNAFTGNQRQVTLTGEAYFEVKHDPSRPFIVTAGKNQIKVLGTHFNVNAYDDDSSMKVTLIEGKVDVDNNVVLKSGQQAVISKQQTSLAPAPNIQTELAWTGNEFVFDAQDIASILSTLSKWYNFSIQYKSGIPQGHFSGTINKSYALSQVLKILESGGIHCHIEKDTVIVL